MSDMIRRQVPVALTTRATTDDTTSGRTIEGIAVPLDTPTQILPGFTEQVARGAIDLDSRPALFYRHTEPIGVVTRLWEDDTAVRFEARVSDTALGRDAYTLAADGAIRSASIGFFEREHTDTDTDDGGLLRTQTLIDLREISLVPVPAYDAAAITNVRHATNPTTSKENTMTNPAADTGLDELRASLEDTTTNLSRRLSLLEDNVPTTSPTSPVEARTGGQLLHAAVTGDETARAALAPLVGRAPATTTSADARYTEPTFVKDLTRLIQTLSPLSSLFSTGTLPADGNTLEFLQLKTNTMTVERQANEGDTLPVGTVTTETKTTTISTYGGAATLSRQAIERTKTNVLDLHLRALTMAAAKAQADAFATFFKGVVASQASKAITTTKAPAALDWKSLLHMLLDARAAYRDLALPLDGLIVDRPTFEAIAGMTDADGRPILAPTGQASTNAIGSVSATGSLATSELHGLHIVCDDITGTLASGVSGAFYSREALRTYTSGLVSLQDTSVLDLTAAFSVYFYAAFADEIPGGIVPLKTANA